MKKVGVIMGSDSDFPVMSKALTVLDDLGIGYEVHVYSAHRTPVQAAEFASHAVENGFGAIIAGAGHVTAVEYSSRDRQTLEDNLEKFGINNVSIIDHVDEATMADLPVPTLTMLVASASMEQEIECLLKLNPEMEFVIYTLDFICAGEIPKLFEKYGIGEMEVIRVSVSKLDNNILKAEPAPWIITGKAGVDK